MAKKRLLFSHGGGGYSADPPIIAVPLTYTLTTTVQTLVVEPEFDFYIPNNEFYLNIPAVSITAVDKSRTNYNDGIFAVMNRRNQPIYYKNITFNNGVIRGSYIKSDNKNLVVTKINTNTDNHYTYEVYSVGYIQIAAPIVSTNSSRSVSSVNRASKQIIIGYLTLRYPNNYYNNDGKMIAPFESVPFSATYAVTNVGQLSNQFYGKTITAPNKNVGTLEFNFLVEVYDNNPLNTNITPNVLTTPLVISVNVVNTGYIPTVYNLTLLPPTAGGGGFVLPPLTPPVYYSGTLVSF